MVKALDIPFQIKKIANSSILYDADILADPTVQLFEADYHTNLDSQQSESCSKSQCLADTGIGRAKVVYFPFEDKTFVLKHYYRGGLIASILRDQYCGFTVEKSRAFREWFLLKKMKSLGLPVPNAIAAHVKQGLLLYRTDLITQKIENSKTLADVLMQGEIDAAQWRKLAACIKRFHNNDIYHADLNARNILLTDLGEFYLIDFDNSDFRLDSKSWKQANLVRLKRSLLKFKRNDAGFNFFEKNWNDFLQGYNA